MATKLDIKELNDISRLEDFRNMPSFQRRTKLEKVYCFSTVIALFMVAVLVVALVALGYLYLKKTVPGRENFASLNADNLSIKNPASLVSKWCLTPGCVKAAAEILSNLDENVEPCNDFYRFACGGWLKRTIIPEHESSISVFYKSAERLNLELKVLLEKELDGTEPVYVSMLRNMYDTCLDIKNIENIGVKPLRKILNNLGGWPVVEGRIWNGDKFDWVKGLKSLRNYGYKHDILLSVTVDVDKQNNSFNVIEIGQPSFGMPDRSYLLFGLNDTATAAYFKQMVKAAKHLGANKRTAERELLEALQFEMTLAKYSLPLEERRNVSKFYNKLTVKDLHEMVPEIPWLELFNGLLNDEIFENETVIVAVPDFVKKLAALLEITEKRVIANYMMWRVVCESLQLLSKRWREIALEYNTALTGKQSEKPRWEQCLSHLTGKLTIALGSYYLSHYFKEETKDAASELVKYVHEEVLRTLDGISWMDETTKNHAKSKANDMIFYIGYPEELLNKSAVVEHYQNLSISNDSYFENVLRLHKWSTDNEMSMLRKLRKKREWKNHANVVDVNAYNFFSDNIIEIPAGILRSPFFRKDRPNYLNFGAIGLVIGHEIIHAFDDQGRQYDKNGNNVNWWAKTTDEEFRKKAQCIIDQYSNYTAENGMNLNGINTQGENIADNGATKEAYWAYQTWVKHNGPEQLLPGLKYNQNQLYWISAANVWCSKYRPEDLRRSILSYYHSPGEFRVTGPMSNLAEFAKDFKCPLYSPMNKKHRCQVW